MTVMIQPQLTEFIDNERERFHIRDNNVFAFSFGGIGRYYSFLTIILARYEDASRQMRAASDEFHNSIVAGSPTMTPEQQRMWQEHFDRTTTVHMEIESFYLFAKILLDRVARAIEHYFGSSRGLTLDSHDDLAKCLPKYVAAKGLTLQPASLLDEILALKTDISDYRDYEIAHLKNPRRMKGTMWSNLPGSDPNVRLSSHAVYPTERDVQVESRSLHELMGRLDSYLVNIIEFVKTNAEHTALNTDKSSRP